MIALPLSAAARSRRAAAAAFRPTLPGLFWLLAVLGLLASAINYGNNQIFALAFVLLAIWLQAAWRCRRHLARLVFTAHAPAPVFAGETLAIAGRIAGAQPEATIALAADRLRGADAAADAAGEALCELGVPAPARGEQRIAHLRLVSRWPLGLWQAQRALPALTALVHPAPAGTLPLPANAPAHAHRQSASDDFQDLRRYAPGDTPRRINWRILARRDELLVNRFDGDKGGQATWLDFADAPGDTEARLAQICAWVLAAEHAGRDYGLRLPGLRLAPAIGRRHRGDCLRHLALYGKTEAADAARTLS